MTTTLTIQKNNEAIIKRLMKVFLFLSTIAIIGFFIASSTYAATFDPLTGINNLKNLLASIFEAIGIIVALVGVFVLATGFMSHDPSQKITGITAVACGILLAGATYVINYIVNG